MLLYANGFWSGFLEKTNPVHFGFFEELLSSVFDTTITVTTYIEDADILLESYFGSSIFSLKKWKYSIFFSGEAIHPRVLPTNIEQYTFCMGAQKSSTNFVSCPLYLAYEYCTPFSYPTTITKVPTKSVCSVISAYHPGAYRYTFIDLLEQNGIEIDHGGTYKNTIGYTIQGDYSSNSIVQFQNQYKLVLALENTKSDHYITEKILNTFRSGTIPVYFGSDSIGSYFNPDRFVEVKPDSIQETIDEIKRLLTDTSYWLEKVNQPIFRIPIPDLLNGVILSMKNLLLGRSYSVEVICNIQKEQERFQTLQPILDFYSVKPSCTFYGEEARHHNLFSKFYEKTNINAISLAINHISLLKQYQNLNQYLLILESDVIPLYDLESVHSQIENTIEQMKEYSIDFIFIGKGCFDSMYGCGGHSTFIKLSDTIYKTDSSRCTESYIVSPRGIQKYIDYFNNNTDHTVIDFSFNHFAKTTKNIIMCWRVPELFKQGTCSGTYKSTIPSSSLHEKYL